MKYYVSSAKKEYPVDINGDTATIDGRRIRRISTRQNGTVEIDLHGTLTKAFFVRHDDNSGDVYIDNWAIPVTFVSDNVRRANNILRVNKSSASTGIVKVLSPMPGLITKIMVKENEEVKPGVRLCMLEAMKMENEIRSDVVGVIAKVLVKERDAVEKGKPIIEIKLT